MAPHVRDNKDSLEQAISESQLGGPPPTAHASPGGIRDKSVRDMVPKKLALNDLPEGVCGVFVCVYCILMFPG